MASSFSCSFKRESEVAVTVLRKKFDNLKYNGKHLSVYINEFSSVVRQLREANCQIETRDVVRKLLSSLPAAYVPIVQILRITEDLGSFEKVRAKLLDFELELNTSDHPFEENAVAMMQQHNQVIQHQHHQRIDKGNGVGNSYKNNFNRNNTKNVSNYNQVLNSNRCRNCNLQGHFAKVCRKPKNLNKSIICDVCTGFGHIGSECKSTYKRNVEKRNVGGNNQIIQIKIEIIS